MIPETLIATFAPGRAVMAQCDQLATISEEPGRLTRRYLTDAHRRANAQTGDWMRAAGMSVRQDAVGNVIGRYAGRDPTAPALLIGSHLDTVCDAGKYDGTLGVLLPVAAIAWLNAAGWQPPFPIDVIGFAEEEGARFATTLIGSAALTGRLDPACLSVRDEDGISIADAMVAFGLDPEAIGAAALSAERVRAFLELHIEQGPVLETEGLPVGVVTGIAGASRWRVTLEGEAGHAGTVPMGLRRDALAAAAACVLAVEELFQGVDVVATVGRLEVAPGVVNVIPGRVSFTIDARAADDGERRRRLERLHSAFAAIARQRGLRLGIEVLHDSPGCLCHSDIQRRFADAAAAEGVRPRALLSGAGHDTMEMVHLAPAGMLFVRCEAGISHNPAESVSAADVSLAGRVLLRVIAQYCQEEAPQ